MNFYWRFIQSFFCIATSLTEIIKEFNAKLKKKLILQRADFLSLKIKTVFQTLIEIFISALFLQYFNVKLLLYIEMNAFDYTISDIFTQKHLNDWKSTAYFSQKMISAEWDYQTHDRELLIIVKSFCHWKHYLKGLTHSVEILIDYSSLWSFMTTHKLLWRQVQWALSLFTYDFIITYWKDTLNSADSSSWRSNHQYKVKQKNEQKNVSVLHQMIFSTVTLISVEFKDNLLT